MFSAMKQWYNQLGFALRTTLTCLVGYVYMQAFLWLFTGSLASPSDLLQAVGTWIAIGGILYWKWRGREPGAELPSVARVRFSLGFQTVLGVAGLAAWTLTFSDGPYSEPVFVVRMVASAALVAVCWVPCVRLHLRALRRECV